MEVNVLDYVQHIIVDVNHLIMESIVIKVWIKFWKKKIIFIYFLGIAKREEIIDESNSAEQDLIAYERDLEEDRDDLRRAINDNNDENYE